MSENGNELDAKITIREADEGEFIYTPECREQYKYIILKGKVQILAHTGSTLVPVVAFSDREFFSKFDKINNTTVPVYALALNKTKYILAAPDCIQQPGSPPCVFNLDAPSFNVSVQAAKTAAASTAAKKKNAAPGRLSIMPEAHKTYDLEFPSAHTDFLYDREINCPICSQKFKTKAIRKSRLRAEGKARADSRTKYKDIDPIWYGITVCPYCGYANNANDFDKITDNQRKILEPKLATHGIKADFLTPVRDINQVFFTYYLAMLCINDMGAEEGKLAKTWLNLMWLYEDVEDEEMHTLSADYSLELLKKSYFKNTKKTTVDQEQRTNLLLGELSMLKGNITDAGKFYYSALVRNGGNSGLNMIAEDKLQEIKTKKEPQKETAQG